MKRIYIAGRYSAGNTIELLDNIREGIEMGAKLIKMGHSPFCPWLDHQFQFFENLEIDDYYNYSMSWLEVSDAILVLPGYKDSKGTLKEIERANELGIPIYYNIESFKK